MNFPKKLTFLLCALLLASCTAEADTTLPVNDPTNTTITQTSAVRITEPGTYRLSGTYNEGITVITDKAASLTLILDGADITSEGSAINIRQAGDVTVTLENASTVTATGENAAIFSVADLTMNGEGSLTVVSAGDGISSKKTLTVMGGNYTITSGGGAKNAEPHEDEFGFGGGHGGFSMFGFQESVTEEDSVSKKAVKSGGDMLLSGGTFVLDAADDALHSNANMTITDGTYTLATGDDGVHADFALVIDGGNLTVTESYEGIEAKTIDVNGGYIDVTASDDGVNASGGSSNSWNMMAAEEGVYFTVNGGTILIDAGGDGLDSNGDFTVNGGEIYVAGPENGANGALDYNGNAAAHGGTVIAAGAAGMAESFGETSTQGALIVNTGNQAAGTAVTLTDAAGNVLAERTFDKTYSNVVVTCPGLANGGTYTLTAGTYTETIVMDGLLYGEGMGMGGMFGGGMNFGGRGDKGDRKDFGKGDRQDMSGGAMPEMPEGMEFPGGIEDFGGERPAMPEGMGEPRAKP